MIDITESCTGCRACEKVCPKHCISMKPDQEGFLYPIIDEDKCIDCGACRKTCPQNNKVVNGSPLSVYAIRAIIRLIYTKLVKTMVFIMVFLLLQQNMF